MLRRRDFLRLLSVSATGACLQPRSQASLPLVIGDVRVDSNAVQHSIDPRIHGHFIEHIGRVIHQGLWAELLRNRKFYPVDPDFSQVADPWKPDTDRSGVSYVVDQFESMNGVSSQRVTLFGESPEWRGISQSGFDVLGGRELMAFAWIKGRPHSRSVSFRLKSSTGQLAARADVAIESAEWKKYEVRLRPPDRLEQAVFQIAFDSPGTNWLGCASLMPADHVGGIRRDVLNLFQLLGPTIFRWPGGCYADAYDWRKAIGPRDYRPPVPIIPLGAPNGYDHGIDPNDFGTDEFLELCRLLNAEPYINANFGMGSPDMAAAWVEYCNGPVDSPWGSRRASNGHPSPYEVKLWAIGNETYGDPYESGNTNAEGYAAGFLPIAHAMRVADSGISIAAVGAFDYPPNGDNTWNSPLLASASQDVDYLSLHSYYPAGFWRPELLNRTLPQYMAVVAQPTHVETRLTQIAALLEQASETRRIRIAFDEWNELDWNFPRPAESIGRTAFMNTFTDIVRRTSLEFNQTHRDGLYGARMLHTFMRSGDRVSVAVRTHPINSLATIRTDSTRAFMTASGKMMQLYRQTSGASLLKTVSSSPTFDVPEEGWQGIPYLDAVATESADGKCLVLHLINLHPSKPMDIRIQIAGKQIRPHGEVWQIAPQDFMERNDFGINNVDIASFPFEKAANDFTYQAAPHSATALRLTYQ